MLQTTTSPTPTKAPDAEVSANISNVRFVVDLDAMAANYHMMQNYVSPSRLCPVVKADAYGLGMIPVARRLASEGATTFFVAQLEEGIKLRHTLPDITIGVMDGLVGETAPHFTNNHLLPVLNTYDQLVRWRQAAPDAPFMLHVDTGMNRLGFSEDDIAQLTENLDVLNGAQIHSYHSHFASSGSVENSYNKEQLEKFQNLLACLPKTSAGIANSEAAFLGKNYHFDYVRSGRCLYGVPPATSPEQPIRPVVFFSARILQRKTVKKGQTVGYGRTFTAPRDMTVATIGAGYADALLIRMSNKGHLMVGEHKAPIVGRISMDLITLDVTDIPENITHEGAFVEVVGSGNTIAQLAKQAGTIGYEILTRLSKRHTPKYKGEV